MILLSSFKKPKLQVTSETPNWIRSYDKWPNIVGSANWTNHPMGENWAVVKISSSVH